MALPITNLSFSIIAGEVGATIPYSLFNLCNDSDVESTGIDLTYCSGGISQLISSPYQTGNFRNYEYIVSGSTTDTLIPYLGSPIELYGMASQLWGYAVASVGSVIAYSSTGPYSYGYEGFDTSPLKSFIGSDWLSDKSLIYQPFMVGLTSVNTDAYPICGYCIGEEFPTNDEYSTENNRVSFISHIIKIDTSYIPNGAVISSASFSFYNSNTDTSYNTNRNTCRAILTDTSVSGVPVPDYTYITEQTSSISNVISVPSSSTLDKYTFTLNSLGISKINKTGNSYFRIMSYDEYGRSASFSTSGELYDKTVAVMSIIVNDQTNYPLEFNVTYTT